MLTRELRRLWRPIEVWPKLLDSGFATKVDRLSQHQISAATLPTPTRVAPIEILLGLGEATREGVRATADPLLDPLARWWPALRFLGYFASEKGHLALNEAAASGITRRSKATVTEALGIGMSVHLARSLGARGMIVDVDSPGHFKIQTTGPLRPDYVFYDRGTITHVVESKGFTATGSKQAINTAKGAADQVMSVIASAPHRLVVGQQLDGRRIVPMCCLVSSAGSSPPPLTAAPRYGRAVLRSLRWAGVQASRGRWGGQLDVLEVADPLRPSAATTEPSLPALLRGTILTIGSRVPYSIFFGLVDEVFEPLQDAVLQMEPQADVTDERARVAIELATAAVPRDDRRRHYERRDNPQEIEPLIARSRTDDREFALMVSDSGYALGFSVG